MTRVKIRRALVSVHDKAGLVEFARGLIRHHVELLSTGGTFQALKEAGIPVAEVAQATGAPEMLDGRVKTLHPTIHGGILYRRDKEDHVATVHERGIPPIDLVVVNLYPFELTIARPAVTFEEAIENIDIGGPAMIRSAAKNHAFVAVLTEPGQYGEFLAELAEGDGSVSRELLARLAARAFARTARYDAAILGYLSTQAAEDATSPMPAKLETRYLKSMPLRYGENPHQAAALYVDPDFPAPTAATASQRHGKELSYNNLLDLDAALSIVREQRAACVTIIKHNNPCGTAVAATLELAFRKAWDADPVSAFGSVIAANRPIDAPTALALAEPGRFVEALIAPEFTAEAFEILTTKPSWKKNVRLLEVGPWGPAEALRAKALSLRPLDGAMLVQTPDLGENGWKGRRVVTRRSPSEEELLDLEFAWSLVKHVKSNAIVLAKGGVTVGVGAGQMSRVDSVHLATRKAGAKCHGSVLASDAFFPFRDNVDQAAAAGITALVQPGGSVRDQESIDACDEHGIAMLFTGMRHFKH